MEGVDTGSIISEVLRQGMQVIEIEYHLENNIDFAKLVGIKGDILCFKDSRLCVVCYGDIDFVRQVHRRASFVPGVWCNFDNMKCSTYYAHFGEHLLNQQYVMMPVGELWRRWDNLSLVRSVFTMAELEFMEPTFVFEQHESLFVRPNSGAKPFTGYVVRSGEMHKIQQLIKATGR